jgi:preprotein translocase subunit SecF
MTKVIGFDKSFKITVPISLIIIIAGLIGAAVLGMNNGVDFQAGLNSTIQFVPPSMDVGFKGEGTMTLKVAKADATFISRAPSGESKSYTFAFSQYPTMQAMTDAFKTVPGVSVALRIDGAVDSKLLLGASQTDAQLGESPVVLHYAAQGSAAVGASIEAIRSALKSFGDVSIQRSGAESDHQFMIRLQDTGKDPAFSKTIVTKLTTELEKAFGANMVLVNKSDFVGARFSKNLASQAIWLTLGTFVLIMIYCAFRFKPAYAIGAVLSVMHDALIMVAFIVFSRMEFNTSSIAAILTIVGYSINDTIVIYDRILEKVKFNPSASFRENMNRGVTETLSRTFITVATVLLAAISLFIFTSGSMKDFSLAIIVGLISGTYSSVFIASAFVDFWMTMEEKRKVKKLAAQAGAAATAKAALVAAHPGKLAKAGKKA